MSTRVRSCLTRRRAAVTGIWWGAPMQPNPRVRVPTWRSPAACSVPVAGPSCNLGFSAVPGGRAAGGGPHTRATDPPALEGKRMHALTRGLDDDCRIDDRDLPESHRSHRALKHRASA